MFDIGAAELLVIVITAIVVIGPKEMPRALRTAGRWIGKMRRMSNHFRTGLDAMIREEVAHQSVMQRSTDRIADGSQPIDAEDLDIVVQPRFDLSEFWGTAGERPAGGDAGEPSATVRAIEGARTPDELLEMLEAL